MQKWDWRLLIELFATFFKIGSFTFGGGYAMIPLIQREIVHHKKWVAEEDIIDVLAVSQAVPGAVAINAATFIGQKIAGRKGALAATLGVVLPSLLIITVIAAFFSRFQDNKWVQAAFAGIRPAVVALIAVAAYKVGKASIRDCAGLIVAVVAVLLILIFDIHAIFMIIGGAVVGLAAYRFFPEKVRQMTKREGEGP